MKTKKTILCDSCKKPIESKKGFVFHGNVFIVRDDGDISGGIIGNNFPTENEGHRLNGVELKFSGKDVGMNAFCNKCLINNIFRFDR
jgi:hypothetical protein